jgi:hypothetical protein
MRLIGILTSIPHRNDCTMSSISDQEQASGKVGELRLEVKRIGRSKKNHVLDQTGCNS